MIVVRKKDKKKILFLSIMAGALALLLTLLIVLNAVLMGDPGSAEDDTTPELMEGEDLYGKIPVAYTRVPEGNIVNIMVSGKNNNYALWRDEDEKTVTEEGKVIYGPFYLTYRDEKGIEHDYMPDICEDDINFSYENLYATVNDDTFGMIPKITYLCTAIGTTYFDTRIPLPEDAEKRQSALLRYGFGEDAVKISFSYDDDKGARKKHEIVIGEPMITGLGYYFMVDGRDYVYSVETNNYFQYALASFISFIKPTLTAAGLSMDSAFEPYLTTDFKQYKNTVYDNDGTKKDANGNFIPADVVGKNDKGYVNLDEVGYKVIVDAITTVTDTTTASGYLSSGVTQSVELDLNAKNSVAGYDRVAKHLWGKKVGALTASELLTLYTYSRLVYPDDKKTAPVYDYTITKIESLLLDDKEIITAGATAKEYGANLIKVTYTATQGGKAESENPLHAVIDLTSAAIPSATAAVLREASVGTLATPVSFRVDYSLKNSEGKYINPVQSRIRMVITDIIAVVNEKGEFVNYAVDGTKVMYRYYIERDGVRLDGDYTDAIVMKAGLTGIEKKIYDGVKNHSQSIGHSIEFYNDIQYTEIFADFMTYEIKGIRSCVESEIVASFRYQQASNRDPFYGESLYENTLENKYSMYGLNASACEAVVKMLGGVTSNSATKSEGLSGLTTVAVGITPELMLKYNLYDYSIYFELPRGIKDVKYDAEDQTHNEYIESLDDYTYYGKLGFNLYISRENPDGTRYIASDAYDVIALINADSMEFLNYEFTDFYARRYLILTNVSNIYEMKMEFNMDDVYGTYTNRLDHQFRWQFNNQFYKYDKLLEMVEKGEITKEDLSTARERDFITVFVTPEGKCIETELSKLLAENEVDTISLHKLYGEKLDETGTDDLGTANYKEFLELLFYTYYEGNLDEAEQEAALDGARCLLRMSVTLGAKNSTGEYLPTGSYDYVYEFYRISDRQVLVKMYQDNGVSVKCEVADFYISTFSFKKIVNAYFGMLNKVNIENDTPYDDTYIK